MSEVCTDDRFEIIDRAKHDLLECTNIDTSPDEMKVLDNFLFRCWQMGWIDGYKNINSTEDSSMTIRKLVHELTNSNIDWDMEIRVNVSDKPMRSGEFIKYRNYPINRVDLFTPTWYIGDQCILTIGKIKEK